MHAWPRASFPCMTWTQGRQGVLAHPQEPALHVPEQHTPPATLEQGSSVFRNERWSALQQGQSRSPQAEVSTSGSGEVGTGGTGTGTLRPSSPSSSSPPLPPENRAKCKGNPCLRHTARTRPRKLLIGNANAWRGITLCCAFLRKYLQILLRGAHASWCHGKRTEFAIIMPTIVLPPEVQLPAATGSHCSACTHQSPIGILLMNILVSEVLSDTRNYYSNRAAQDCPSAAAASSTYTVCLKYIIWMLRGCYSAIKWCHSGNFHVCMENEFPADATKSKARCSGCSVHRGNPQLMSYTM